MIIQIWIHYEALWLFVKGVTFIPHPDASETTASRIIATIMTPFFAIQEWWDGWKSNKKSEKEGSSSIGSEKEKAS